ncbi:hypothetical protein Tco_1295862 [Tanacetum coccineum]
METSKRRRSKLVYIIQQLSKGSSEGSVQDVYNGEENKAEENKADAKVVEKQAGNKQPVKICHLLNARFNQWWVFPFTKRT